MNIKIGRKLAIIDKGLSEFKISKNDNVFEITAVTDNAVNMKNIYNYLNYTLSIQNFEKFIKTFLTDEIIAKRNNKKINQATIQNVAQKEVNEPVIIKEVTIENQQPQQRLDVISPNPIGKIIFKSLDNKGSLILNNPYANDPYNGLYG